MQANRLVNEEMGDFFRLLEQEEPQRCMFDLDGRCEAAPVKGHFIQEGLLKLIRTSDGRVKSFYDMTPKNISDMSVFHAINTAIKTKNAASRPFLCDDHEGFFSEIENPRPDWNNPEHLLKVSYRTSLINLYVKEWLIDVCSKLSLMDSAVRLDKEQLRIANPLTQSIRNDLAGSERHEVKHTVAYIGSRPVIAATGIVVYPPKGSYVYNSLLNAEVPMTYSPFAINVLPDRNRQVALFSYRRKDLLDAKYLFDKLEVDSGSINTGELSKKIIEELEFIHISQTAWNAFSETKQNTILKYWDDAILSSAQEIVISPNFVDLFTTV